MPFRVPFCRGPGIVNHGDQPVSVPPDVEDHIAVDVIGIFEHLDYFREFVPADRFDNGRPRFDFVRRIRVALNCLAQVPAGDDMHSLTILHNL